MNGLCSPLLCYILRASRLDKAESGKALGLEEALVQFHNTETFEKLCDRKTALYIESPVYVYETFMDECRLGTLRTLIE